MTVSELIEKLKEMPGDLRVVRGDTTYLCVDVNEPEIFEGAEHDIAHGYPSRAVIL